jgi:hypothetical protein
MKGRGRRRFPAGAAPSLLALGLALGFACAGGSRPFYPAGGPPFISPKGYSLLRHAAALGGRTPAHRVILVGDAGVPNGNEATLAELGRWSGELPERTAVAFLGDNLYPRGLGEDDERGEAILLRQLRATSARKVFVPGNHDWGDQWPSAETLLREQRFLDGFGESPAALLPKDGCPGPVVETLAAPGDGIERAIRLVAIDLDWWLLDADERPACEGVASEADFVRALERTLREHAGDHVVVVAHHPIRTGGPHGGWGRSGFANSMLPVASWFGIEVHDLDAKRYREMLVRLRPALAAAPPLVYAAGHDHNLQVIEGRDEAGTLVVSGAASPKNVTTVTAIARTLYAHAHAGFVVLDFYGDADFGDALAGDRVMLRVIETGRARPVFEMELPGR